MRLPNIILSIVLSVMGVFSAMAQPKGIRKDVLPNGMTYYIAKTNYNPGEVNFYLFQNVGAILEDDNEQGFAHYLEHMAFNATDHFPRGVMTFFMEHGIKTFDASTGINETRYQIGSIPTSNTVLIDSVMFIIKDWCNGISIKPKDVDKERNIIMEEWRVRNTVDRRLTESIASVLHNDTKYAYRNVIGHVEQLKKVKAKDLKKFYKKWYRPDLQSIMIIGDIDIDLYEAKVKELFGSIPAPKKAPVRSEITIPDNTTPEYFRFIDKENHHNSFGIYQRVYLPADRKDRDYTFESLCIQIFNSLAPSRFGLIRNDGTETFLSASVSYGPFVRSYHQNAWDVVPYAGRSLEALEQVLSVREWIRREGFGKEEFEHVKGSMYQGMKEVLAQGNLEAPYNLMEQFKQNYLYDAPLKTLRTTLLENSERLTEIEWDEFNDWIRSWMKDENLAFITYSATPEEMNITLDDFNRILAKVKAAPTMKPVKIDPIPAQLIDYEIPQGKIISDKVIKGLDAKEWTLANGGRVVYKNVPEMSGMFYFVASSEGGRSVIEPEDLPSYSAMQSLLMRSGLYKYNRNQLHNWVKDKKFEVSLSLTDYTEGLGGNSAVEAAEDFFKYVHLILSKHRFEREDFNRFVERKRHIFNGRGTAGMTAVQDSINALLYPASLYNPEENTAFFDKMKYDDLYRLFEGRFGNAGEFTFCVIGDISEERAKDLVQRYIASLPGKPVSQREKVRYMDFSSPEKEIVKEFYVEKEGDSGEVELSFSNSKELSKSEVAALKILEGILQNRLFAELREKDGGTYSIGVNTSYTHLPQPSETLGIRFSTEKDKVKDLKDKTYQILEDIIAGKFTNDEFKKVHVPMILESRENAQDPSENPLLWIVLLNTYVETGEVPSIKSDFSSEDIEKISKEDVINLSKKIMDGAKKRDIVVKSFKQAHYGRIQN